MPIKTSNNTSITKIYGKTAGKHLSQSTIPPINFHSNTDNISYNLSGNMTQASTQEYSITDIPPIDFMSDGNGISAYSIYGNMVQASTPSHSSIVIPEECGDKTAQLFDGNIEYMQTGVSTQRYGFSITADAAITITVTITGSVAAKDYCYARTLSNGVYSDNSIITGDNMTVTPATFTLSAGDILFVYNASMTDTEAITEQKFERWKIVSVEGATAPATYIPYGFQIPVTNAGTTTNIYALEPLRKIGDYADVAGSSGAVTRQIKKFVLTGKENVSYNARNDTTERFAVTIPASGGTTTPVNVISTHFNTVSATSYPLSQGGICMRSTGNDVIIGTTYDVIGVTSPSDASTITNAFKAFLAQEYANGNPVTVWYVLATPTTETITSPTITTVSGTNTLSIGTTLQPSSVSLTTTSSVYPKNPIIPEECGDLVESGEHAGEYKIPLNLNNTISNIYLSQPIRKIGNYSDSIDYEKGTVTRQIKKLVLTGQESWEINNVILFRLALSESAIRYEPLFSTHFISKQSFKDVYDTGNSIAAPSSSLYVNSTEYSKNLDGWKSYLAQQYSNGTPVCVWYVLATPEVEQITPPTITPSMESNTISVDTTLQPSNLSITYTSPDYSEIKLVYDNQGNILYNDPPYHDWGAVRWIVRQGLGPQYYPIGYIFYDTFNPETGTAFQVVAHNKHFDPNLTALGYTYSMTLCEVLLTDVITFDAIEAFLYVTTAIPAGTYKFTIPNYDSTYGGNKTYYFTSTAELPVNSQIVMNWPYQQTPKTVTGYAPTASITAMENTTAATDWNALTLTEWVDGTSPAATDLGTIAGPPTQTGTSNYGDMNHINRARYGSNNYYESGIRQYMNATGAANTWWKPSNKFDRPYNSRSSAGKLNKLNQDFVNVLAYPTIKSKANTCFETVAEDGTTFTLGQDYTITTDKMFLLSPVEVGFSTTDTSIGTLLDYYVDATNDTRIKKRKSNNTAYYWWLRTPNPSSAVNVRLVYTSGALNLNSAYNSYGLAAACTIQ